MALLISSSLCNVVSKVLMSFWMAVASTEAKVPSGWGEDSRLVPIAILLNADFAHFATADDDVVEN